MPIGQEIANAIGRSMIGRDLAALHLAALAVLAAPLALLVLAILARSASPADRPRRQLASSTTYRAATQIGHRSAMVLKTIPPRIKPANQSRAKFRDTAGGKNAAHYRSKAHAEWAEAVKARDGYRCVMCGAPGPRLIADHKAEIADGGYRLSLANGETLCLPCHNQKTARVRRARASWASS